MINAVQRRYPLLFVCAILSVCEPSVCVQTYQYMCRCGYVMPKCFCPYIVGVQLHHLLSYLLE